MTIETLSSSAGPRVTRRRFLAASGGLSFAIVPGANGARLLTPARAQSVAQGITAWDRFAPAAVISILPPGAAMAPGPTTRQDERGWKAHVPRSADDGHDVCLRRVRHLHINP